MADLDNINYLQPTGFKILVDGRLKNFTYFAQELTLPDFTTNAANTNYSQFSSVPFVPDTYQYGELSMNVILDEDMDSYTEILDWAKENVDKGPQDPEDYASYSDLIVTILTSKNNLNKQIKYRYAFPINIGAVSMNSGLEGTTPVITFPVTFRYSYFEFV